MIKLIYKKERNNGFLQGSTHYRPLLSVLQVAVGAIYEFFCLKDD